MDFINLSSTIEQAQLYFLTLATEHGGEVTVTFKIADPKITLYLGPQGPIGFGNTIGEALLNAASSQKKQVI